MKYTPQALLILLLLSVIPAFGQVKKGYEQLRFRDYQGAHASFSKALNNQKQLIAAHFGLARTYYEDEKRQRRKRPADDQQLLAALEHLSSAQKAFAVANEKTVEQLKKLKIGPGAFKGLRRRIQHLAFDGVVHSGSIVAFDDFKSDFSPVSEDLLKPMEAFRRHTVQSLLDSLDFIDYGSLTSLVQRHGDLLIKNSLKFRNVVDNRLYKSFVDEKGYNNLRYFARDHPKHWASIDCWLSEFVSAYNTPGVGALLHFLDNYPLTIFDIRAQYEIVNRMEEIADPALTTVDSTKLKEVLMGVDLWEAIYTNNPKRQFFQQLKTYLKNTAPSRRSYMLMQDALQWLMTNKKWDQALELVKYAQPLFPDTQPPDCDANYYFYSAKESWFKTVIPILEQPTQNIVLKPLREVNTNAGDEFSPVISLDGNILYFAANNRGTGRANEDVFVTQYDLDLKKWGTARKLSQLSGPGKQAPLSLTADGNQLLLFNDGQLFISNRIANDWSKPELLPPTINNFPWMGRAVLSPDGQTLIFSASYDALESFYDPDINIYLSRKDSTGKWQPPFSVGPAINTPKQERSPFLHPDNRTLYFSSDGHPGLGGVDVFVTKRLDDTWTRWSEPINLGKEVNSLENDWGYNLSVNTGGNVAYLSSDDIGVTEQSDLYFTKIPSFARPEKMELLRLNVQGVGISSQTEIQLIHPETKKILASVSPDSLGNIQTIVFKDSLDHLELRFNDPFVISGNQIIRLDSLHDEAGHVKVDSFEIKTIGEVIVKEEPIPLPGIDFETGAAQLDTTVFEALERVFKYVKDRKDLKLEIVGHTDDTGTQSKNQELSQKRAMAVKAFLHDLGLEENRMLVAGLGSSQPLSENDTEQGRALNRRVEIYIR